MRLFPAKTALCASILAGINFLTLPVWAQDQTSIEVVTPVEDSILSALGVAAESCRNEIDAELALADEGESVDHDDILACRAHEQMKSAYWAHQTVVFELLLDIDTASVVQATAEAEAARNTAQAEAARTANTLASVLAEGLQNEAEADNALANIRADGYLQAAKDENALALEEAEGLEAQNRVDQLTSLEDALDVAVSEIEVRLDTVEDDLGILIGIAGILCPRLDEVRYGAVCADFMP